MNDPQTNRHNVHAPARSVSLARCALALLTGAVLLAPVAALAGTDGTCQAAAAPGNKLWVATVMPGGDYFREGELRLQVTVGKRGSGRVHGVIHAQGESGRPRFVARGAARIACADVDGDGAAGLVRLETTFRDTWSGERIDVVLAATGHDLDARGVYTIARQFGEETSTGEAQVRVRRDRPGRGR
jgi:hypothetical protein